MCSDIPSLSASDSCVSTVSAAFGSELAGPLSNPSFPGGTLALFAGSS